MHQFVALLRHIHRELYLLGPEIVPVTLSKYRMICAALICGLCVCAAVADSLRRRWVAALLWLLSAGLLLLAFRADSMLWKPQTGSDLAIAAISLASLCVLIAFWHELQRYITAQRLQSRKYRRVPGTRGAPLPGTGPRQIRNSRRP